MLGKTQVVSSEKTNLQTLMVQDSKASAPESGKSNVDDDINSDFAVIQTKLQKRNVTGEKVNFKQLLGDINFISETSQERKDSRDLTAAQSSAPLRSSQTKVPTSNIADFLDASSAESAELLSKRQNSEMGSSVKVSSDSYHIISPDPSAQDESKDSTGGSTNI